MDESETQVNSGETIDPDIVEGGEIQSSGPVEFQEVKHRAETARALAMILTWVLALTGLIHYGVTAALLAFDKKEVSEELGKIFNVWLPVISGLVGAATTYYFTKQNQQ